MDDTPVGGNLLPLPPGGGPRLRSQGVHPEIDDPVGAAPSNRGRFLLKSRDRFYPAIL